MQQDAPPSENDPPNLALLPETFAPILKWHASTTVVAAINFGEKKDSFLYMHLPAYIFLASLSARPEPLTRSLNDRRQPPRTGLPPHRRGRLCQSLLPPVIPTLERCPSTSKTDYADDSRTRHSHSATASSSSTYPSHRQGSLRLYPAAALPPFSAATAFPSRPDGNNDPLVTSGRNHTIASAHLNMAPGDRPRQPPSIVRAANRTPLTPKVAPKGAPVLASLAKRPQGSSPAVANAQKHDVASPVSAFLATNVTPRTGHRQTRVDSTNSTPNATPNLDRSDGWDRDSPRPGDLAITSPDCGLQQPDMPPDSNNSNKFFYASDAKNIQIPCHQRQPLPTVQKGPTFFYANAASNSVADRPGTSTPQSAPTLSPSNLSVQDPISTKFFYANGTPDLASKPTFPASNSNSSVPSGVRLPPGNRPPLGSAATVIGVVQRPTSPLKNNSTTAPVLSPILRPALSPSSPKRSQTGLPATTSNNLDVQRGVRRVSIDAQPKYPQAGGGPGSELQLPPKITASSTPAGKMSPPASPGLQQTSMTMASLLHAAEELQGSDEEGDSFSIPQSPSKSNFSDGGVSELVANARRERKVQDLEITNASLEAINRTLERQLRKQTAELRRYRRLSRSGRLSLASAPNSRVVSEAYTDPAVDLSDLSEAEESEEEEDELDDSIEESDVSMTDTASISAMSVGAMRRKRDEKRLQLDLTKHQELLIDSQKMNQSIKRCLNWTEALIKEGQKALEYHVRVSEVEFGGRVLAPVDEDDRDVSFQGVDQHDATVKGPDASPPYRPEPDRDSGIELPPHEDGS